MSFSILILTLNEEINLAECLESVSWCDDVVVLDAHSRDNTVEIARRFGARVVQRPFDDFASQRNYALESVPFKHHWVFHLDADERFTRTLLNECTAAVKQDRHSGYFVPSKTMLMGRWLRWAATYPVYQVRLLKVAELRFVQHGHGQQEGTAPRGIGRLEEPYLHFSFSKGFQDWFAKHNRYSTDEAEAAALNARATWSGLRKCLSTDTVQRRRALKQLSWCLPCRPAWRFLYMYLFRGGFLDGEPGYIYCRLVAMYEAMTILKVKEIYRRGDGHTS